MYLRRRIFVYTLLLATAILLLFLIWSILNWSLIVGTLLILPLLMIFFHLLYEYFFPHYDGVFRDYVAEPPEIDVKSCFPPDFQSVSYDEQSLSKILPKSNLIK